MIESYTNQKFKEAHYMLLYQPWAAPSPACTGSERMNQGMDALFLSPGSNAVTYFAFQFSAAMKTLSSKGTFTR
jgi:hypothetical protein